MDTDSFDLFKNSVETIWVIAKSEPLMAIAIVVMAAAIQLIPVIKRSKPGSKKGIVKGSNKEKKKVSAKTGSSNKTRKACGSSIPQLFLQVRFLPSK